MADFGGMFGGAEGLRARTQDDQAAAMNQLQMQAMGQGIDLNLFE